MKANVFLLIVLIFYTASCTRGIHCLIINQSKDLLEVKSSESYIPCAPASWTKFKRSESPDSKTNYIIIMKNGLNFTYSIAPFDRKYIDLENRRVIFVFKDDGMLYLAVPTNSPINAIVTIQPNGYPLVAR